MFQFAVALEAAQRFAAHARRRARANAQVANLNGLAEPQWNDSFTNGVEVAGGAQGQRGTPPSVLQSGCFGAAELPLVGTDDPTFVPFAALNVLRGGIGAGHPLDRGMELELETGDACWCGVVNSVTGLSDGELVELCSVCCSARVAPGPAPSRLDPALDCEPRGGGGVGAQAGRALSAMIRRHHASVSTSREVGSLRVAGPMHARDNALKKAETGISLVTYPFLSLVLPT